MTMCCVRHIALVCILLIGSVSVSKAQDYTKYHESIIQAEKQIFVDEQIEKGLNTYLNIFSQYDFVFLSDCITALQISMLVNDERAFLILADKATKNGLLPRHLVDFHFINKHPYYQKYKDSIISLYRLNRPAYLKRIDTVALQKIYDLFAFDQMEKLGLPKESNVQYKARYKQQVKKTVDELTDLILTRGFPSDKVVGIAQRDIMRELKLQTKDLVYYAINNTSNYNVSKGQLLIYEWKFSSTFFFPILAHYGSMFSTFQFYDDDFYLEQIKLGNLHPRDMAYVLDFPFSTSEDSIYNINMAAGKKYFFCIVYKRIDLKEGEGSYRGMSFVQINGYRKKFYIAPIEQDLAKLRFAKKYGIYIGFGDNGNR